MDKSAIRNFAIEARKMLMKSAETEAGFYGVTKNGCKSPIQKGNDFEVYETIAGTKNRIYGADIKRRANLVKAVETLGFEQVIEETAYTWFNRIIAIRFMEVNDYLPTRVRVLSSETGSNTPDIVTQSLDVDLNMTPEELEKVQKAKDENRYDDAFRMLFIKQCNELNAILPGLFEKTDDYMELLLKLSYTSAGVVRMLVDSIDENNFNIETEGQVEIIGWMYQYYNIDPKTEIDQKVKKGIKVSEFDIAAKTQIFTPDWVVRYMIDNSLGRLWLDGHPDSSIQTKLQYYIANSENQVITDELRDIKPEDIKVIDPCMGSGHMLVYAFEVLMYIYEAQGYSPKQAAQSILCNNLYGIDIDDRAYQLAYFSVLMKARQYNRRILSARILPNLCSIQKSKTLSVSVIERFAGLENAIEKLQRSYRNAKDLGSIINVLISRSDLQALEDRANGILDEDYSNNILDIIDKDEIARHVVPLIRQTKLLVEKYDVVVTNPPYLGNGDMNNKLSEYIQENFAIAKSDLYSVFMLKGRSMLKKNRYQAMVTMQSWMNLGAFEKLREYICTNTDIVTLWHLDDTLLGIAYQTAAFVLRNTKSNQFVGNYYFTSKENYNKNEKNMHEALGEPYMSCQDSYLALAGIPIAYSLGDKCINSYVNSESLSNVLVTREGMTTGNNDRFLRLWHEVASTSVCKKWFPYNKGGEYRKWYGNDEYYVMWENDGFEIKNFKDEATGRIRSHNYNGEYAFRKGITWSAFSSKGATFRYSDENFLFDSKGSKGFCNDSLLMYILAFLNSSTGEKYLSYFAGAKDKKPGHIISLPYIKNNENFDRICSLAKECVELSKEDWDSFENSWNFLKHPLIPSAPCSLEKQYNMWRERCNSRFEKLKIAEEEINSLFIDVYNVSSEVTSMVEERNVTIYRADLQKDIKSFLSYAVGCMFGRYSVDNECVVYAGGEWDRNKYNTFIPDKDNCIPITDEEYFEDDIVGLLCAWMEKVYGEKTLEENLAFIANSLGNKGTTSREVIRNYFLNDFIKDHIKTYQKRPIYWMFDSGKQNGFKALCYMHRYNKDTLNLIRSEYLRKTEDAVENALKNAEYIIQTSASAVERAKATKDRDRYVKQLNEMRVYNQALSHLALQKIEIDLDDGVKHNYQLFQDIEVIADGGKKQKVDLLVKI